MARNRDERGTRYFDDDDQIDAERERRHRRRRNREHDDNDNDDVARRERRERRRADEARRAAELDIDDLRARRESYYSRPDSERRRNPEPMVQEIRRERVKEAPRTATREIRRDGTRRTKRREVVADDRSDDYVYGRPKSRAAVEELPVRRSSARKRSDEGGSSSRTAYTPRSGSGSASVRRVDVSKLGRSMSARDTPKTYATPTRPSVRRTSTIKLPSGTPQLARTQSTRDVSRRSTGGIFANLFTRPTSRTPVHKETPLVDCLVCMNDELPVHKTVKLGCGHRMCHSCLKRQFTLSVQDPQHMPPRCCTTEHIPLKYADRLFDDKFKILWNKKYQEYTTSNRLYCPNKGCGQWIKPSRIRMDLTYGRKYARCGSCSTKVCVLCNERFHTRRECPKDEETNRLVQMAKEQGWQRCYNCKAVVELKEGCNHMTCRCTAQFCMVCAAPWKTCNCPWFNYQNIEDNDRINDMRVPYTTRQHDDVVEVIEMPDEPSPPLARRSSTRSRHRSGRDRERDRDLEHADRTLAAHLQAQLHLDPNPTAPETRRANPGVQVYGLGNSGGHHMNESYTMRPAANVAARTIPRAAAPRASFFSRRVTREAPARPTTAAASAMAGLSRDGTKRGANRVGTWLSHVQVDEEAIHTAARDVEVDDWRCDGTMIGID
ncbi:IBR domain-containing protein [Paraphoma chrysanthemicola]|uniref:RBR-type E3 ubiquitin transferase n=1 Tax=Paraphoma chrysanthemicola TaxID=798071 RepID=A0A8K0VYU4_9PLEO|nr:IBR domain-containing protein [Paraphoma chrysanthemicola]